MSSNLFNSEIPKFTFKNIDELYNLITGNTTNSYTPIKSNPFNSEKKEFTNKISTEIFSKKKIDFNKINSFTKTKGKKRNRKFVDLIDFNLNNLDCLNYKKVKDEEEVKKFKKELDKIFSVDNKKKLINPYFTKEWVEELEKEYNKTKEK